jgi:hypothetical protein
MYVSCCVILSHIKKMANKTKITMSKRKYKRVTICQGLKFGQAAHQQQQQQGGEEDDEDEGDLGTHSTVLLHVVTQLLHCWYTVATLLLHF